MTIAEERQTVEAAENTRTVEAAAATEVLGTAAAEAAEAPEPRLVRIKSHDFAKKGELYDYLAEQLGFPEYSGRNLDALYDSLTEVDQPTVIRIERDWFDAIVQTIRDAAADNPYLEVE